MKIGSALAPGFFFIGPEAKMLAAELERVYAAWEVAEARRAQYPHLYRMLARIDTWAETVSPAYFSGSQYYRWLQTLGYH